jgi:hypothetical protein
MSSLKPFWKITIHIPVIESLRSTEFNRFAEEVSRKIQPILRKITSIPGVGVVGNYDEIYELDLGFEGFRPRKGASPHYGRIGEGIELPKAAITTYVERPCRESVLAELIDAVKSVHPWEHPMIEFIECFLYVPTGPV